MCLISHNIIDEHLFYYSGMLIYLLLSGMLISFVVFRLVIRKVA